MDKEFSFNFDFSRRNDHMVGETFGVNRILFDEASLAVALFHHLPARARDLLRIGLAVYAADRLARRSQLQQTGGARVMRLRVGVIEPDFWSDEQTLAPLQEALELLGGDAWHLTFRGRPAETNYLYCETDHPPRVCLYSGGLDSAAGLATQLRNCHEPVLGITIGHQRGQKKRVHDQLDRLGTLYDVDVKHILAKTKLVHPPELGHQELTQRCRSFLFAALGGAVACAEQSSTIEVYESGVGAMNIPLAQGMATGARTTKSTHPRFLRLMSNIISRVAERRIDYVLPHKDKTKAEIVRTLAEDGLNDLANSTVSCVHYPVRDSAKQCGYCPACIGRRQAMIGAGISEPNGTYAHDLFGPPETTNSIDPGKLAWLKVTLMQVERFGELRNETPPEWFLRYALGTGFEADNASWTDWIDVLLRYRAEWLDLVSDCQSKGLHWASWLPAGAAA